MRFDRRRVAALVLAAALSLPGFAASPDKQSGRSRTLGERVTRVVQHVKKFIGSITPLTGLPSPPIPAPPPKDGDGK